MNIQERPGIPKLSSAARQLSEPAAQALRLDPTRRFTREASDDGVISYQISKNQKQIRKIIASY